MGGYQEAIIRARLPAFHTLTIPRDTREGDFLTNRGQAGGIEPVWGMRSRCLKPAGLG